MEYEEEDGFPGSIPEFGAIFMSNVATKKECFRRKLLGLPSVQANFVKQVKAGMVLFLFEFERRELYGVFQACSDGEMNIVPHAFSLSGRQFPAQVRFTPIWYCSPLSEHEFRGAIKENYFSTKKFNFGLSEDQVRRLLWLFNSSKLENKLPQRQFSRQASKPIGKDRRVAGNGSFFLRNREEKSVGEEDLVSAINTKYPGNSSSNVGRQDDDRFLKNDRIENELNVDNCLRYDNLTGHLGAYLRKRRRDDDHRFSMQDRIEYDRDVDHGLGQVICTDHQGGSLCQSGRVAEGSQFLLSDRVETRRIMDSNFGPTVTTEDPGTALAKVRRFTDDDGFAIRDIVGDKRSLDNDFGLDKSTDRLDNPAIKARRPSDDLRFVMDCKVKNDCNLDNGPEPIISVDRRMNPFGEVRGTSDDRKFSVNDRIEIERHLDNGIRPILSDEYLVNPLGKVKKANDDGNISMRDRAEIPSEHFVNRLDYVRRANDHDRFLASTSLENEHNVDNGRGPVISTAPFGYPLDEIRREADEGMYFKSDRVDNAYNMENCVGPSLSSGYTDLCHSRKNPSFYSSKPMLETDYSFGQNQHKPFSLSHRSMERKNFKFSYPTPHDAIVTRAVPDYPEVTDIHCRCSLSVGIDCTSYSVQDCPPHHSSVGNLFSASMKRSSPYRLEAEDLSQCLDVTSDCVNKVPLAADPNHYDASCCRTSNSLLTAGYYGKTEAKATSHEVHRYPLFSDSTPASLPFSRSEIYERLNISPSIEFDKPSTASQGRYKHKIPQHETDQAFSFEGAPPFNNNMAYLHSDASHDKLNDHNMEYCQNSKGMYSDSKSNRTSVFARLTLASDVQENDTYMGYDQCDMDASVDQVMDALHQRLNKRIMKVRKFPLARQCGMKEMPTSKKRHMIYNQIECDKLTMMTMKMKNEIKKVLEENCDQIAEETRVVDFKRRSETKRSLGGTKTKSSVETVEHGTKGYVQKPEGEGLDKQHKRRKLVRPVFGKKEQLSEGLSRDGSSNLQLPQHESSNKDNTGSFDDSIQSLEIDQNARLVQLTGPTGGEEGNNAIAEQRSECREKNAEKPVRTHEGINSDNTSNLQLSPHGDSNAKENTGSWDGLVRSHENDSMSSQNVGFMHVTDPYVKHAQSRLQRKKPGKLVGVSLRCDEGKDGKRAVAVTEDAIRDLPN